MTAGAALDVVDILGVALGKVLRAPDAFAPKGTPENDRCWAVLDPALQHLYFALERLDPEPLAPAAAADGDHDQGTSESAADLLKEAERLLSKLMPTPEFLEGNTDHDLIEARCSGALESIRSAARYVAECRSLGQER